MINTLFVNGCSWTEGYLLEEEPHVIEYAKGLGYEFTGFKEAKKHGQPINYPIFEIYNEFNWAGTVAKELNIPTIINSAEGGGSNYRIVRTTVDYVRGLSAKQKKETLVIIGWTLTDRSELYLDDKENNAQWMFFNAAQEFSNLTPSETFSKKFHERMSKFWESYVVDVHNNYSSIYNFFQQSELLANFLENQGIRYYFFNTFPVFWGIHDVEQSKQEELRTLAEYYNDKYQVLPTTDTFSEFVADKKEMKLSDGHPNSLAYNMWAQHLIKDMKAIQLI